MSSGKSKRGKNLSLDWDLNNDDHIDYSVGDDDDDDDDDEHDVNQLSNATNQKQVFVSPPVRHGQAWSWSWSWSQPGKTWRPPKAWCHTYRRMQLMLIVTSKLHSKHSQESHQQLQNQSPGIQVRHTAHTEQNTIVSKNPCM